MRHGALCSSQRSQYVNAVTDASQRWIVYCVIDTIDGVAGTGIVEKYRCAPLGSKRVDRVEMGCGIWVSCSTKLGSSRSSPIETQVSVAAEAHWLDCWSSRRYLQRTESVLSSKASCVVL